MTTISENVKIYVASQPDNTSVNTAKVNVESYSLKQPVINPKISLVIPLLNEEGNLALLYEQIVAALAPTGESFEILFIEDGSTDSSFQVLEVLHRADPQRVRVIQFRRNFGKTTALTAGFQHCKGEVVITMDADLQDDPAEIPSMLAKLEDGYDLIAAWRVDRQDKMDKTLPSRIFNAVVATATGLHLHDFNCGFKTYRRAVTQKVPLYGELHRFTPVLAHWKGFKIAELPVQHRPRHAGHSKYGVGRLLRGFLDFAIVLFLTSYLRRPLHLFGLLGFSIFSLGSLINLYLVLLWFLRELGGVASIGPIGTRPLLTVGVLGMLLGIQLVSIGLLGEMLRYFTFRPEEEYTIWRMLEAQ
ncbi:MAG: glycosyltransferase family 2 protein [Chloroflexi bacterium]|nr:glycosyltransferase family 2 protein [Chloroflexota bacterium]